MMNPFKRILSIAITAITILIANPVNSYPTYGWGWTTYLGGSNLTVFWETTDNSGLATQQLNYFDEGRLCISGEVNAKYTHGTLEGEAVYKLLGTDDVGNPINTQGICYSYVTRQCDPLQDADGVDIDLGTGTADNCIYTVPSLEEIVNSTQDDNPDNDMYLSELVSGRMQVVPGTGKDYLAICNTSPEALPICDFKVGIGFDNPIPPTFFPATVTTNGDSVDANVILHSRELCFEYTLDELSLDTSFAINAKSDKLRACEALTIKGDFCSNLTNHPNEPVCDRPNPETGQLATAGFNNAAGDFIKQQEFEVVCMDDVNSLRNLQCGEVNLAACSDGNGLIEMPSEFKIDPDDSCHPNELPADDSTNTIFASFSSSDGSGTEYLNVSSILNYGSPGNPGNSNLPACTSACITSTPNNTEINDWNFSSIYLFSIGYIDGQGGDDIITGSKGPDTIRGSSGVDKLSGDLENDVLLGGDNGDFLYGNEGNDLLIGYDCFGPNSDCSVVLNNGSDDDTLDGGPGNDCIDGGRGNDIIIGGPGADAIVLYGDTDSDIIDDFNYADGDRFIALNVSASIKFIVGKRGADDVCVIETGGNNAITFASAKNGLDLDQCKVIAGTIATSFDDYPQCKGHPGSF